MVVSGSGPLRQNSGFWAEGRIGVAVFANSEYSFPRSVSLARTTSERRPPVRGRRADGPARRRDERAQMALHPSFPSSPYAPLVPEHRWFPAAEQLRGSADKLLPPL